MGFFVALPTLILIFSLDCLYYGKITFPAWNFLKFNVIEGKSRIFGTMPFYKYFTFFLPFQLNILYPLCFIGLIVYT